MGKRGRVMKETTETTFEKFGDNHNGDPLFQCTECLNEWYFPEADGPDEDFWNYCPNCGRKVTKIIGDK